MEETNPKYPGTFRRSLATLIDLIVLVTAVSYLIRYPLFPDLPWSNAALISFIVLAYEPLLSTCLCTLGQALMGTRIRRAEGFTRISPGMAYHRFALKYVASIFGTFGAVSSHGLARIGVWPDGDHRAIHDLSAGTVVVSARPWRNAGL